MVVPKEHWLTMHLMGREGRGGTLLIMTMPTYNICIGPRERGGAAGGGDEADEELPEGETHGLTLLGWGAA